MKNCSMQMLRREVSRKAKYGVSIFYVCRGVSESPRTSLFFLIGLYIYTYTHTQTILFYLEFNIFSIYDEKIYIYNIYHKLKKY